MADTDAPGCRRLHLCLRERPHVIGKPRLPYRCLTVAASLLLPHSTEIPLWYLYIWQPQRSVLPRLVAWSHNGCVQTAEIKKSDWRMSQFRHVVQDHARAVLGTIGGLDAHTVCSHCSLSVSLCVLILLLVCLPVCAHTAPGLSPCVLVRAMWACTCALCPRTSPVIPPLFLSLPVCWLEQRGRALVHCAHARAQ